METIYFFPSAYVCCRGIFIKDSMPSWSVLLSLRRCFFLIQSWLCLNVPHTQETFRTTKISILTKSFKYNPQDCFFSSFYRSVGVSEFLRTKYVLLHDHSLKLWPSYRQNTTLQSSTSIALHGCPGSGLDLVPLSLPISTTYNHNFQFKTISWFLKEKEGGNKS